MRVSLFFKGQDLLLLTETEEMRLFQGYFSDTRNSFI